MLKDDRQREIWNRASLESGGTTPGVGDQALAALLNAHSLVMNGGVVHALECLSSDELAAAVAGFDYFGLGDVRHVFEQEHDDSEETETALNDMYQAVIPSDGKLQHAFRVKLLSTPEAFAPTDHGAHA